MRRPSPAECFASWGTSSGLLAFHDKFLTDSLRKRVPGGLRFGKVSAGPTER
jgi:hypothetical protein